MADVAALFEAGVSSCLIRQAFTICQRVKLTAPCRISSALGRTPAYHRVVLSALGSEERVISSAETVLVGTEGFVVSAAVLHVLVVVVVLVERQVC